MENQASQQKMLYRGIVYGLPPRFKDSTFENFIVDEPKQQVIVDILKNYALAFSDKSPSLILVGNPGTGKGHLVCSLGKAQNNNQFYMRFVQSYEMLKNIKSTWKPDSEDDEDEVLGMYQGAPLLCIDDVGIGFASTADKILFYEVIDYRYNRFLPTIITANCSLKSLEEIVGENVIDRLLDNNGKILTFSWSSHRRQA